MWWVAGSGKPLPATLLLPRFWLATAGLLSAVLVPPSHPPTPRPRLQLAAQQAAMGVPMTPEAYQQAKIEREMDERNR